MNSAKALRRQKVMDFLPWVGGEPFAVGQVAAWQVSNGSRFGSAPTENLYFGFTMSCIWYMVLG